MILFYIFIFILGLAIGSFVNVLVYRFDKEVSVVKGRSKCPSCEHKLSAIDLIPLFGFFIRRGKCAYCNHKISWQYPVVEFMTGLVFALVFWKFSPDLFSGDWFSGVIYLLFLLFISAVMIFVFVYDLKHYLILDKVIYPSIVISIIAALFLPQIDFFAALLGSAIIGGFFLILVLLSKERMMGWGDAKLAFLIGLVVPWPTTLAVFLLAFVGGSLVALLLMWLKLRSWKDPVPFGTFLAVATLLALFVGKPLVDWYINLIS